MKKYSKVIFNFGQLLIGIALSTMAMACFALPYGMVVSGVTGVSRTINFFTGTGITPIVYILNIGFFVIGAVALGKKFAASIAVGTFAYPIFLQFFQGIESLQYLVEDPLVAAICAGILDGVGMVIRIGGSTGGIEIPPLILHKKFGWKVPPVLLAIDILVFLSQLPFTKTNGVILGILYAIIYSIVMDKVLLVNQGGVQLIIFSQNSFAINEKLLEMGYGTTILQGVGGYLRERNDVIYSVVGNRAVNGVKNAILEIDENAFITISSVNEVKGNGFTNYLKDEDYIADVDKRNPGKI